MEAVPLRSRCSNMASKAQLPLQDEPARLRVDSRKVAGRRAVHFRHPREILADAEQVVQGEYQALGNLSAGQIFMHLARNIDMSIDGVPETVPWPIRIMMRLFFKQRLLTKAMPTGLRLPAKFARRLMPPATTTEAGLKGLREAIGRLQATDARQPSPLLGPLTKEEWDQLHCRHAELHLSFLVPIE